MAAVNSVWCFLVPLLLVLGTVVTTSFAQSDDFEVAEFLQQESEIEVRCPPKERFDECLAHCQKNCSNINENPGICPGICQPGCVCIPGLVRGPNGNCIPPRECPAQVECPRGEHFDGCEYECQKNCTNWDKPVIICPRICVPGCVCDKGTVRSSLPSGPCIKPEKCPPKDEEHSSQVECPRGEHFDECDFECQKNCTNWDEPAIICPRFCVPGCVCDKGTVRASLPSGPCVKPERCPPKDEEHSWDDEEENSEDDDDSEEYRDHAGRSRFCPPHEEFIACRALCELNCKNRNATEVICPGFCVSGCKCVSGYVRGPNGTCIKPDKCPDDDTTIYPVKRVCPRREIWNPYVAHCQGNCSTNGELIPCVRMGVAGCICRKGLTRRDDGKCIRLRKCPKKEETSVEESFCPANEEFVKCNALWEDDCGNSPLFKKYCVSGCRCVSGYVRGPKGTCIKKEECPTNDTTRYPVKRVCPKNELWSGAAHCQKNCTHPQPRPCPRILIGGCVCRDGWYRRPDGKCVPKRLCFKKEEISSEDVSPIDVSRELIDDGSEKFCPPNEEFIKCKALWEEDCGNTPKREGFCVSGCRCKSGYVRGPKGTCIKKEACPSNDTTRYPVKRVCPRNEHWSSVAHCQKNCTHQGVIICERIAVYGCVCDKGLYRRPDGKCVPLKECFKVEEAGKSFCPANEVFVACQSHCEKHCGNKNESVVVCPKFCVSGCRCIWGYVRGPKGTCIKPEKCPAKDDTKYPVKRVCPTNEHWIVSTAHCQRNCTYLIKPVPCPAIAIAGCVCDKGLLRRKDGKCIPSNKCPKKVEDAEDEMLDEEEIYTEDDESKAKSFCPPHEVFVACLSHCEKNCGNKNESVIPCAGLCVSGCRCIWGYVRGPKGTCIKPEKCPAKDDTKYPVKRVCPRNEHWETTRAHCQRNCTNLSIIVPCLDTVAPGCVCNEGLYRGKDGKCVPRNKCPKKPKHSEDDLLDQDIFNQDEMLDHDDNFDQDDMLDEEDALKRTENSKEDELDEENAREENQSKGNCPNERLCTEYCRGQGRRYGRCVGRGKRTCFCR